MKRKLCLAASASIAVILSVVPAYGAQWVQSGDDWYYMDENGKRLRNTISEDGYLVDYRGKYVPLEHPDNPDPEKSSNFFMKYLETGDAKYLTGSEHITVPAARVQGRIVENGEIKDLIYSDYVDYQSCMDGDFTPTWPEIFDRQLGFRVSDVYPDWALEVVQKRAQNYGQDAIDENNMPLYYEPYTMNIMDKGDFLPLSGAKNRGFQVYEVTLSSNGKTVQLISQRDAYRAYKDFIDMATEGTENMSKRELALHFEKVLMDYMHYSYTLRDLNQAYPKPENYSSADYDVMAAILAGSGVCQNYAELYKLLCDIAGINCRLEAGKVDGVSHAWNLVEIDGTWYHVDTTWADTNSDYEGLMEECHKGDRCDLITGKVYSSNAIVYPIE